MATHVNPDIRQYKYDGFKFDISWQSKFNMSKFHAHDEYEIYFLIDGNCQYFIGNSLYTISKNEMILIPPKTLHKTLYNTVNVKRFSMNISAEYIPANMLDAINDLFENNVYIPQNPEYILALLKKINQELENGDSYSQTLVKCYVAELLAILVRTNSKPITDKNTYINESIDKLIKYISENISEDMTLSEAAKFTNFSVSYLSKLFLKTTGLGFKEYIQTLRIKKSQTLLETTKLPIHTIASDCGFNDSNYFSKAFKDHTGVSPLKYRKLTSQK